MLLVVPFFVNGCHGNAQRHADGCAYRDIFKRNTDSNTNGDTEWEYIDWSSSSHIKAESSKHKAR
jgi:hypothetical protein